MSIKLCNSCGIEKTTDLFGVNSSTPDKLSLYCKDCNRRYNSKWRENNRDKTAKSSLSWKRRNPKSVIITAVRSRAKRDGIPFNITEEDFDIPEYCPILGLKLKEASIGSIGRNSPSLDKILPELGYVKGNVRVISNMANSMKQDATPEELILFCKNTLKESVRDEKNGIK